MGDIICKNHAVETLFSAKQMTEIPMKNLNVKTKYTVTTIASQ